MCAGVTSVEVTLHGSDTARARGLEVKGRGNAGPICPLARNLIAAGVDASTPMHVTRDGVDVFASDLPVSWWAGRQCRE